MQQKELSQERDQLKGKVQELNKKVDQLSLAIQEAKTTEKLLEQRAKQLEVGRRSGWERGDFDVEQILNEGMF